MFDFFILIFLLKIYKLNNFGNKIILVVKILPQLEFLYAYKYGLHFAYDVKCL